MGMDLEFVEQEPTLSYDRPVRMHVYTIGRRTKFQIIDSNGMTKSFYMDASALRQLVDSGKDFLEEQHKF